MTPYFRRQAAQRYRAARASTRPHLDYEALMLHGRCFKEKPVAAATRLAQRREAMCRHVEGQEQAPDRDSCE